MAAATRIQFVKKHRSVASGFLLALFLALYALVTLPGLHAWIHPDASDPDHECAVTLISHGQVDVSYGPISVPQISPTVSVTAPVPVFVFVSADVQLLPGRGPPAASVPA